MRSPTRLHRFLLGAVAATACATSANAHERAPDAAQANNPLANFTAFNLHNYFIGELTAPPNTANQFWLRYAKPIALQNSNWIFRGSLPINTVPVPPSFNSTTGLGDFTALAAYLIDTGKPGVSFGIGPQLTVPTGGKDTGTEKWSAGFANLLFDASSPKFQYGYLLTWQTSFAGSRDRANVNVGAFQPFAIYQLGDGLYLRSVPLWVYNFESSTYSVPVGIGIGQVIPTPKVVFNVFIEPQWSIADKGPGWPQWQVFTGFNMQFKQ
jgi:hypothetical protein